MASNNQNSGALIELKNISLRIGPAQALDELSFSLEKGRLHALVGRYAEGKSTLCAVMAGELQPNRGSILIDGRLVPGLSMKKATSLGIGKVSDRNHSFPQLTVEEEIGIGSFRRPNRHWFGRYALSRSIRRWLDELGFKLDLECKLENMQTEECLFVSLLSRLYRKPRLLILDETLERIPVARLNALIPVFRARLAEGMSILWATHNLELAWKLSDTISLIRRGRVVLTESPSHLDRRSLIYLAYSENPDFDWEVESNESFQNIIRYTEAVLRDLPTAIAIIDMREIVQFVNSQGRMFFIGSIIPEKANVLEELVGQENIKLLDMIRQALREGSDERCHSMLFLASFGESLVDAQVRIIRDGGVAIGVMIILEDVSERENMRATLCSPTTFPRSGCWLPA